MAEQPKDQDQRLLEGLVSAMGGGPPPGYGVHPSEAHYWDVPEYQVHPLTGQEEAVGGLFHRMWRENVEVLLKMKAVGWPHVEIIKTAKELWKRQKEQSSKDEDIIQQHKEAVHIERRNQVQNMYMPLPQQQPFQEMPPIDQPGPPQPEEPQMPPMPPFQRSISHAHGDEYANALENFRGRFYSRDAPGGGVHFRKNERNLQPRKVISERISGLFKSLSYKEGDLFKLPNLPYEFDAFEPIMSEESVREHYEKHHKTYTDNLNKLLKQSDLKSSNIEELMTRVFSMIGSNHEASEIRDQGGGYVNHNLWWETITPNPSSQKPSGTLLKAIKKSFKGMDGLKQEMLKIAQKRFGSGWIWLALTPQSELVVYNTLNQDSPLMWEDIPLFGIDLWEHAYYLDYKSERVEWVNAVWKILNWNKIQERYENAMKNIKKGKFGIIVKGDTTGGEPTLTPKQLKRQGEMTFTRKDVGISNAASTGVHENDDDGVRS